MDSNTNENFGSKDRAVKTVLALLLVGLVVGGVIDGGWAIITILFALAQFIEAYCYYS